MTKRLTSLILVTLLVVSLFAFVGCIKEYGYTFYFYVDEGEGELTFEQGFNPTVHLCEDVENMYFVRLRGGKEGFRELTFIAIPEEGYRVKEWVFNEKVVEGNNTDTFTAKVSSDLNYKGVIAVRFEKV